MSASAPSSPVVLSLREELEAIPDNVNVNPSHNPSVTAWRTDLATGRTEPHYPDNVTVNPNPSLGPTAAPAASHNPNPNALGAFAIPGTVPAGLIDAPAVVGDGGEAAAEVEVEEPTRYIRLARTHNLFRGFADVKPYWIELTGDVVTFVHVDGTRTPALYHTRTQVEALLALGQWETFTPDNVSHNPNPNVDLIETDFGVAVTGNEGA
jgi:hypothetical protein